MNSNALRSILFTTLAALVPGQASVAVSDAKRLSFYHTHTTERITVTFFEDGQYDQVALADLNEFLSDFRNGENLEMDPALFDILHELQQELGGSEFQVISAYRSPETNEMLRSRSSGVAKKSQHLLGKAIDVRLAGVDTALLRETALDLKRGGVGYYRQRDFVHIDTGRVRRW